MADVNLLADTFHSHIKLQTVLIRHAFKDENGEAHECHGTGIIIGHGRSGPNNTIKIATAGHVLDDIGVGYSTWEISRIEADDRGEPIQIAQTIIKADATNDKPPFVSRCKYLRGFDIGVIAIENKADGWPDNKFIDIDKRSQLKVSPRKGKPRIGARVAWAGFPGFVKDITGSYHLCYFEGVVSATANEPQVYFVDGHTAPGVSGGPLWITNAEGEPVIIGVCINYTWPDDSIPGLVGFCPLSVLLNHLEEVAQKQKKT